MLPMLRAFTTLRRRALLAVGLLAAAPQLPLRARPPDVATARGF